MLLLQRSARCLVKPVQKSSWILIYFSLFVSTISLCQVNTSCNQHKSATTHHEQVLATQRRGDSQQKIAKREASFVDAHTRRSTKKKQASACQGAPRKKWKKRRARTTPPATASGKEVNEKGWENPNANDHSHPHSLGPSRSISTPLGPASSHCHKSSRNKIRKRKWKNQSKSNARHSSKDQHKVQYVVHCLHIKNQITIVVR